MFRIKSLFYILLVLFLAFLLSGVFLRIKYSPEYVLGDGGDNLQFLYHMYAAKQNIFEGHLPFSHRFDLRYPTGFDFSRASDGAFAILTGALFSFLVSPVIAYDLAVYVIVFLNLLVSFICFYKIANYYDKNTAAPKALIAAIIFGTSPFVLGRLNGHLNLAFVAGFPLIVYVCFIYCRSFKVTSMQVLQLILGIYLVSLGSLQYIIALCWIVLLGGVFVLIKTKGRVLTQVLPVLLLNNIKQVLLFVTSLTVLLLFTFFGYFKAFFVDNSLLLNAPHIHGNLLDFIIPNSALGSPWALINGSPVAMENVWTIGTVELVFALALVWTHRRTKEARFFTILTISIFAYGLGYINIPLYNEETRAILFLSLGLSLFFLACPFKLSKKGFVILFVLLVGERLLMLPKFTKLPYETALLTALNNQEDETVLTVPLVFSYTSHNLIPVFSHKKVFDGYFAVTAETMKVREFSYNNLSLLICPSGNFVPIKPMEYSDFKKLLIEHKIHSILLNRSILTSAETRVFCKEAAETWEQLFPLLSNDPFFSIEEVYKSNTHVLYRVVYRGGL